MMCPDANPDPGLQPPPFDVITQVTTAVVPAGVSIGQSAVV